MKLHRPLLTVMAVAGLSACVIAAPYPRARAYVDVDIAPPPVRVVAVPVMRPGYVWAPGYWRWTGREHVWIEGAYLRERPGYRWHPAHWEERRGRYHFEQGYWER